MLIAATGAVSESLQKGVLHILGTVAGAVIGLSLIALFPQDRMLYLFAVSVVVALVVYLYNAYQGDSTAFMLTAVVTLMVFNGGDAEGAFLYGVDRAFMTAFGVIVYTVVASTLWPVRVAENTREEAADVLDAAAASFRALTGRDAGAKENGPERVSLLLATSEAFHGHLAAVRNSADGVADYAGEWRAVEHALRELQATLVPALRADAGDESACRECVDNYDTVLAHIDARFRHAVGTLRNGTGDAAPPDQPIRYRDDALARCNHLVIAQVAARCEVLERVQEILADLQSALDSLVHDRGGFRAPSAPAGSPVFVWLDLENAKTAARAFCTFWIATALWIEFNPPGGFMFVTMCTVLVPLVSFTPATPKLLFILLTIGFLFALPAYVFLLPQMTHWLQLGTFLFTYAFVGFFLFPGPVALFFLLGLFTLGIQNTMNYHVDVILLVMLMFYMVCAVLVVTTYFPFTSRAELLYASLCRRFFSYCASAARHGRGSGVRDRLWETLARGAGSALLARMAFYGARISPDRLAGRGPADINALNEAAEILHGQLQVARQREPEFAANPLVRAARERSDTRPVAVLCEALASGDSGAQFARVADSARDLESRLDEFLGEQRHRDYDRHDIALFYVFLELQTALLRSLQRCRDAQQALDWRTLTEPGY